jgi:ketosteroid isomerase-like protein
VGGIRNAERSRGGFALWNERRMDELLELFHEDVVWDMRPFAAPDLAVYRGHRELRRFFDEWLQAFPDSTIEVEDVEERGDWTLTLVLQVVSGAASGTPVPFRYAGVGHWRDGRLDFVENHVDAASGRAAFERYAAEGVPD